MSKEKQTFRCAIYTRKSSDEGLDQPFNSLDAQREAGEAYVKSQSSEGWKVLPAIYDDGGYSGGTMERPALQRLLTDIASGLIDIVVVYKIDRLTRSLSDFSRIVEIFEKAECSFVSVTQSFNTTNSMGRLMLNVLLSFAQFEREVTGERIRDKIAASKAKGMWMGGNLPLGYDLPAAGTRTLQVNHAEAETVRQIFSRYLEIGSVHALQRQLAEQGICSKLRTFANGRTSGGGAFSRGALFHLLRNPIYCGLIRHKGELHDGAHDALVDEAIFKRVQEQLDRNARRHRAAPERRTARAPLTGRLFGAEGEPMSPCFSHGRSGRIYRYYASASLQQGTRSQDAGSILRISAPAIEKAIEGLVARWLPDESQPLSVPLAIRISAGRLLVDLPASATPELMDGERIIAANKQLVRIEVPLDLPLRGGRRQIHAGASRNSAPDPALIAALRKAHRMLDRERGLPTLAAAPAAQYDRRLLRLALLAPELQRDILAGCQPSSLNLEKLRLVDIPLSWKKQREVLGWPECTAPCSSEKIA